MFPIFTIRPAGAMREAGKGGFEYTLGQIWICDGQSGKHNLAGCVVEVGVRDNGAEFEDSASSLVGLVYLDFLYLSVCC